jgi:hypothetical protein
MLTHRQLLQRTFYPLLTDWREQTRSRHLLYRSRILWRLAVHGLQPAVRVGEGRRHVHFAADDFDIGSGFAGAGRLHRFIELAKRGHPRCLLLTCFPRIARAPFGLPSLTPRALQCGALDAAVRSRVPDRRRLRPGSFGCLPRGGPAGVATGKPLLGGR